VVVVMVVRRRRGRGAAGVGDAEFVRAAETTAPWARLANVPVMAAPLLLTRMSNVLP